MKKILLALLFVSPFAVAKNVQVSPDIHRELVEQFELVHDMSDSLDRKCHRLLPALRDVRLVFEANGDEFNAFAGDLFCGRAVRATKIKVVNTGNVIVLRMVEPFRQQATEWLFRVIDAKQQTYEFVSKNGMGGSDGIPDLKATLWTQEMRYRNNFVDMN